MDYKILEFDPHLAIQVDAEWFSEPLDANYSKNRFITLQFSSMKGPFKGRKFILEHPEWNRETALPTILDCLYNYQGRFRGELISEDDLGQNFPR